MQNIVKLYLVLGLSIAFFCVEIIIGFKTRSLALVADAFHYLNDVLANIVALYAAQAVKKTTTPAGFTYALARSEILGAFFNATFLAALGLSIFLQSIERFINLPEVDNPLYVLIVGCVGLLLNIFSLLFVHEHNHGPKRESAPSNALPSSNPDGSDNPHSTHFHSQRLSNNEASPANLGIAAVFLHISGDAVNNIGVIISAVIIWQTQSPNRFYADPAVSMLIAFVIFFSSIPLLRKTARIMLEAAPKDLKLAELRMDLESIPGIKSIHDFHVWHLNETDLLASVHCETTLKDLEEWNVVDLELRKCLKAYRIDHVTIAPELTTNSGSCIASETRCSA